jgi:hypothetical protein
MAIELCAIKFLIMVLMELLRMRKLEEHDVDTQRYRFRFMICEDTDNHQFVGIIKTYELPLLREIGTSGEIPSLNYKIDYSEGEPRAEFPQVREPEGFKHQNKDTLIKICKKHMDKIGNGIIRYQ